MHVADKVNHEGQRLQPDIGGQAFIRQNALVCAVIWPVTQLPPLQLLRALYASQIGAVR